MVDDLTIVDVGVTYLDGIAMTATGWVEPGATMQVNFMEEAWTDPDETLTITDEGDGLWSATATELLSGPAQVGVSVYDTDGDYSSANRETDDPNITVFFDSDSIDMGGFPANADGEFFVDGTSMMTFTFDENGHAQFDPDQTDWFDFQTGQHVRVVGGSVEDDVILADPITSTMDVDADLISGTAPSGLDRLASDLRGGHARRPDDAVRQHRRVVDRHDADRRLGSAKQRRRSGVGHGRGRRQNRPGVADACPAASARGDPPITTTRMGVGGPSRARDSIGSPRSRWMSTVSRFTCSSDVPEGEPWLTDPYGNVGCERPRTDARGRSDDHRARRPKKATP